MLLGAGAAERSPQATLLRDRSQAPPAGSDRDVVGGMAIVDWRRFAPVILGAPLDYRMEIAG